MLVVVGSFMCCSVVVLFACVVLLCVLFEPFKVMLWCRVVACKDNNKVIDGVVVVVIHKVIKGLVDSLRG